MREPFCAALNNSSIRSLCVFRPVPAGAQPPSVDDIADEIDRLGIMVPQKIDQPFALARARAEMNVGQKKRTDPKAEFPPRRAAWSLVDSHGRKMREPCLSFTTLRRSGTEPVVRKLSRLQWMVNVRVVCRAQSGLKGTPRRAT